ncbi:MAG: cytochrome d ubiquinol oxidase subunit II [Solirubrobacterales bacterium]|nr:cytochrome d ubiquinol oxidase subunit II [Solirubrobacterales bacterium]
MSLPAVIALALGLSLTAYAVLAGADFGAGALHLLAWNRSSDHEAIAATIGPFWEANHVWLIFSITILFSAFPTAFSALGTALLAPLTVALVAIVLRSAALGLRSSPGAEARSRILLGRLFGAASVLAPFAFGTVAGGLALASVDGDPAGRGAPAIPWTSPFALLVGALAVALCAELAASFVCLNLHRSGEDRVTERFRRSALWSGICVLMLSAAAVGTSAATAPALWHRLLGAAQPALTTGVIAITLALLALAGRWYGAARLLTLLSGAAVLWGWFVAQAPRLIGTRLTIHTAAATHPALIAIAIGIGIVLLLVLPATYLLFALFGRPVLEVTE